MNLAADAPLWVLALLALSVAAAAIEDAVRLRISNLTSVSVAILAFVAMAAEGLSTGLAQNFLVCAAILAIGTFAFAAGMLGGGDVKLLAALGLWVNFHGLVWLLAATFILGGVLAAAFLIFRRVKNADVEKRQGRFPYGVAIAAGAMVALGAQRPEMQPAPKQPLAAFPINRLAK